MAKLLESLIMSHLEKALSSGELPWTEIELRTKTYWAFKHPSIDGAFIFAPVNNTMDGLLDAYRGCYLVGFNGYELQKWDHFTITQNCGVNVSVPYSHFELITKKHVDN